jgi:glycosyltransferase involved in cell wall biosynthesis
MKLLFVLPEFGPNVAGGIATYYSHLLPALVRLGARVDVCVTSDRHQKEPWIDGTGTIDIHSVSDSAVIKAKRQLTQFSALPSVQQMLAVAYAAWYETREGVGFDVVETTDFGLTFAPWLEAAQGPPVVVQLHGSSGQVDFHDPIADQHLSGLVIRLVETALLGRADELQSCGSSNALEWSERLCRPVEHIWPAWSSEPTTSARPSSDYELARSGLAIGRIQSWKGPDVLCQACAILGERAPTIFWIGRDNPYLNADQSMEAFLGSTYPRQWRHSVVPVGELPGNDVLGMVSAAKFFVVPSKWDTFNLSAVEAMYAGKTLICSDGAGAADLIEDGINGFRFPNGDANRLADLIAKVDAMSQAERDAIGAKACQKIECTLAADVIAASRLERYAKLASKGSKRQANLWGSNIGAVEGVTLPFGFLSQIPLRPMVESIAKRVLGKFRRAP